MGKFKILMAEKRNQMLLYLSFFLGFIVLCRAEILHIMTPFPISFAVALLLLGKNGLVVCCEFFVANLLFDFSFTGLVESASAFFCILLLYLIYKILKKKIRLTTAMFFTLLSQCALVYFNINSIEGIIISAVSIIVSLCFVFIFQIGLNAIFERGIQGRFTSDENICICAIVMILFCGLCSIYIFNVDISVAIVAFAILFVSRCFPKSVTLSLGSLAGIGFAFYSSSLIYEAIFICFAMIACLLSSNLRVYSCIMVLVLDVLFGLFFNVYVVYDFFSVLPLLFVLMAFLALPKKLFRRVKNYSFAYDCNLLAEFLMQNERENIKNRICNTGMLFMQMQNEYKNISIGTLDNKSACEMLCEDLVRKVCEGCPNKNYCRENSKIKQSILRLFELGIEKQKITILDANNLISENCISLSSVIAEANAGLKNYFEYAKTIKTNDQGKLMISEQMGATANMFMELANTAFYQQTVDKKRGREVLDELVSNGIIANECVVVSGENGVQEVFVVIRNKDVLLPGVLSSLKKVFKIDFAVKQRKMSKYAGWTISSFVPSEKYKLSVGFATKSKEGNASGDTYSMIKISDNKYLFAISDGMGHGEKANKISTSALSLVENLYKSGFSNDTVVSSINKILLPKDDEAFATLDACVIDLSVGVADFIKLGATISVIKSQNQCRVIKTDSLPLGIANITAPSVKTAILKEQDILVIASDGIVDSFESVDDFVGFVNNIGSINIQMIADELLEEAQSRCVHKDDMTVIVLKICANKFSA